MSQNIPKYDMYPSENRAPDCCSICTGPETFNLIGLSKVPLPTSSTCDCDRDNRANACPQYLVTNLHLKGLIQQTSPLKKPRPTNIPTIKCHFIQTMPLVSLPCELLLEIVKIVYANSPQNSSSMPRRSSDIIQLAQTCQILRALSITLVYSSITIHKDISVPRIRGLLKSYPPIAASVRSLKLCPLNLRVLCEPQHLVEMQFCDILGSCKRLRNLCLDENTKWWGSGQVLLAQLAPESKKSIETIHLEGVRMCAALANFKLLLDSGEFNRLEEIKVTVPYGRPAETKPQFWEYIPTASTALPRKLESVRKFYFRVPPIFAPKNPGIASEMGNYFARIMPNVNVLTIIGQSNYIYGSLFTYVGLGSHLTELTLHLFEHRGVHELCEVLSKLSPKLTNLRLEGMGLEICHKLFTASTWTKLAVLRIKCSSWCTGIKQDLLRTQLEKLTETRPTMRISLSRLYIGLVFWNEPAIWGIQYIASIKSFERLR